jgi:hypothetical protein
VKHRELTEKIIGCAYRVFNQMGYGFLESVYEMGNYLVATEKAVGLIINFGERKVEIKRKVRDFDEDLSRFQRDQKSLFERPKLLHFF